MKLNKTQAGFDEKYSIGRRCGNCAYFHGGSATCDLVAGTISGFQCCNLWSRERVRDFPAWLSGASANRTLGATLREGDNGESPWSGLTRRE